MAATNLIFKSRMSSVDWALLHKVVQEDNPDLIRYRRTEQQDSAWIIHQVTQFCRNVALPLLQQNHPAPPLGPSRLKYEKVILIPERDLGGVTNHQVLEDFAHYKGRPLTQIIQRYVIDPKIVEQEMQLISKLR